MTELKNTQILNQILRIIPQRIKKPLTSVLSHNFSDVHEIVLRTERPLCVYKKGEQFFLTENGCLTKSAGSQPLVSATASEMTECFNFACGHSVYTHISEIKEGLVTISGGHRIALSGTAVVVNGEITNIRDISTISVRISREVKGCGSEIAEELVISGKGMLICGSPCSGKTTVLRDVARLISSEYLRRVSVIDTRSELASVYRGISQKDVGMCDVLDGFPRAQGIMQAVRTLSPEYIICDEIGSSQDAQALTCGVNSGAVFVATMHAGSMEELKGRAYIRDILSTGAFAKIVFLCGRETPGQVISSAESGEVLLC